jgi:hypothetical protein
MKRNHSVAGITFVLLGVIIAGYAHGDTRYLAHHNTTVPFPYLQEGVRSWPILSNALAEGTEVLFTAKADAAVLAEGAVLNLPGLTLYFSDKQQLTIAANVQDTPLVFSLDIHLKLNGAIVEEQTVSVMPAPPKRPLTYLADFGDDLIRIFNSSSDGSWAPVTKDAFDQYFRRCQLHGVERMIMWLSPMPYIAEPANYEPVDWARYEAQVRALTESTLLRNLIADRKKGAEKGHWGLHIPWDWIRQLNTYRLMRDFGPLLSQSAVDHGVKLTASFRPFETALTKYYELPAFDHDGTFLWGFLPMASPLINYRTSETAFAHYRTILEKMGVPDRGRIGRISVSGVTNGESFLERFQAQGDNLRIVASNYPPLVADSLVLQRQPDATFALVKFSDFASDADARLKTIVGYRVHVEGNTLHIDNLEVPGTYRYLILSNPANAPECLDLPTLEPVNLYAKAGNALGRENVYWVLDNDDSVSSQTRVPGIPNSGSQATEFNATETGYRSLLQKGEVRTSLSNRLLVIDLGAPYSVEMLDLNRAATRENVIKEMKTLLDLPAFDELFVNTRSHVQLSAYQGDGDEGIKPLVQYRQEKKHYAHLGIDRAYAPLAVANNPTLMEWAVDPRLVERITTWQDGEWAARCQQESSPFRWRYARNKAVADGVRLLLQDFEAHFPDVRVRALIPMGEASANRVLDRMDTLQRPDGTPYGRDYNGIWSTINHIRSIGEGMAMLDLSGLQTEPVLFGVRDVPDARPFAIHFEESLRDLADNRGSEFHGPRSFFFEAQYTLRRKDYDTARAERENVICTVLSFEDEVREVILYESADWLYYLPFSDPDLSGNYFIERCAETVAE